MREHQENLDERKQETLDAPAVDEVDASVGERSLALLQREVSRGGHAVQKRSAAGPEVKQDPAVVHDVAAQGVSGPGGALPHQDAIQRSFGSHDVSHVQAHVGGAVAGAAGAIGAEAYATGDRVAFAQTPDLHTAAHEAAHVVQQQAGVHLTGGVGEANDAHEQHADAVADRVLAGQSTESLLDHAPEALAAGAIQRKAAVAVDSGTSELPQLEADQTNLIFGLAKTGAQINQWVQVWNRGDAVVTLARCSVQGEGFVAGLAGIPDVHVDVEPGKSTWIYVGFKPVRPGGHSGRISVLTPAGTGISLHAEGVAAEPPVHATPEPNGGAGTSNDQREPEPGGQATTSGPGPDHKSEGDARIECGVPIKATTASGKANSIGTALGSVAAGWQAVLTEQQGGVGLIQNLARGGKPDSPSGWREVLNDVVAEVMVLGMGAVGGYLGRKLGGVADDLFKSVEVDEAWDIIDLKQTVERMTRKAHAGLVNDVTRSIASQTSGAVQQAIANAMRDAEGSVVVRESFFNAQATTLTLAATDATVSVNNLEGDYQALELQFPGVGFAALEIYRNHLVCEASQARDLQARTTLAMWSAFLARLELGTKDPESWETGAKGGSDLSKNLYGDRNNRGELSDELAKGVLEIHVEWDYEHRSLRPIQHIHSARVRGLSDDLKAMLTTAPLRNFPIPLLVHGKVGYVTSNGGHGTTSDLRVGRNEGGAIFFTADPTQDKDKGADMLQRLGDGDAYDGAAKLLTYVDGLQLGSVE